MKSDEIKRMISACSILEYVIAAYVMWRSSAQKTFDRAPQRLNRALITACSHRIHHPSQYSLIDKEFQPEFEIK
jgi:hypothetical protein